MADALRLSDRLKTTVSDYNQAYEDWRVYIHDHKDLIIDNSVKYTLKPEDMEQYLHRPELYLREVHGITALKYIWIFMFINELITDIDFNHLNNTLYVPDTKYIDKLLNIFKAVIAAGKKR